MAPSVKAAFYLFASLAISTQEIPEVGCDNETGTCGVQKGADQPEQAPVFLTTKRVLEHGHSSSDQDLQDCTEKVRKSCEAQKAKGKKQSKKCKKCMASVPAPVGGVEKPKIVLGMDVNWPPYAYKSDTEAGINGGLRGFGKEFGEGASALCSHDIVFTQTAWKNCWDSEGYGKDSPGSGTGLLNGWYDGCTTYTHAQGVRNRFLEFSDSILSSNKPAGLLVMLNADGTPKGVDGNSNLAGKTIVDVAGWAPTADGLAYVENKCTGQQNAPICTDEDDGSSCYKLVVGEGNDAAMTMLRNGDADAMFVYADQAYNYECDKDETTGENLKTAKHSGAQATWDCKLWENFGKDYAYVQTGQFGHALNGTTLAISKRGSGLASVLNPCIQAFLKTKEYYELCKKHDLTGSCHINEFWPPGASVGDHEYMKPTSAHTTGCADGYCAC